LRNNDEVDTLDRAILDQLRFDGRLSNTTLADRVGLTPAPCLRRVRRLEHDGIITGYRANVDPAAEGRAFEVLINVDLIVKDRATVLAFEDRVAAFHEVLEMRRMFGLPDYQLRVATTDLAAYEAFVTDKLEDTPGIARVDSHLTMKRVK